MKIFFDIETAAIPFENLTEDQNKLLHNLHFSKMKSVQLKNRTIHDPRSYTEETLKDFHLQNGAFHAGLSTILCVSMGWYDEDNGRTNYTISNIESEVETLKQLKVNFDHKYTLIGHNILGFDIPYLQQKYMQHQIKIPSCLQLHGVKPWDQRHQDTMLIYRGGQFQNTSLENLCLSLGVETPKDTGIKGSEISPKYEEAVKNDTVDKFLSDVIKYCEADIKSTYECYKKITNVLNV